MNVHTKRIATAVAAAAAVGLIGTACSTDDAADATNAAKSSAADAMSNMPGMSTPMTSAPDSAGAADSTGAGSSPESGSNTESSSAAATSAEIAAGTELTTADGKTITLRNAAIAASYGERGGPTGYLGKPLGPVVTLPTGGAFITFEHGSLYQNPKSKKVFAVHGAIGGYWGSLKHEAGKLGYPTSDEKSEDGGLTQTFDNGTLTYKDGKVTES